MEGISMEGWSESGKAKLHTSLFSIGIALSGCFVIRYWRYKNIRNQSNKKETISMRVFLSVSGLEFSIPPQNKPSPILSSPGLSKFSSAFFWLVLSFSFFFCSSVVCMAFCRPLLSSSLLLCGLLFSTVLSSPLMLSPFIFCLLSRPLLFCPLLSSSVLSSSLLSLSVLLCPLHYSPVLTFPLLSDHSDH